MDERIASILVQAVFVVGVLSIIWALQGRAKARRQRLTTVAARFGLFVSWIFTGVALVLGGLGAIGFYNSPTPINENTWLISGGFCAAACVVWLLGRGIYFVLAGSLPDGPKAAAPEPYQNPLNVRAYAQAGSREPKAPPRP